MQYMFWQYRFNLRSSPVTRAILAPMAFRCAFQFKLESIINPRKLNSFTLFIGIQLKLYDSSGRIFCGICKSIYFDFAVLKHSLFTSSHLKIFCSSVVIEI